MFFRRYDQSAIYFDHVISWLTDTGLTDYFHKRHIAHDDIKEQVDVEEEELMLEHFLLPLVFGLTGLTIAALVLAWEHYALHK